MLHYQQIEFLTHERQAGLSSEAEARRRAKAAPTNQPTATKRLRVPIGARLVQWGRKWQGQPGALAVNTYLQAMP